MSPAAAILACLAPPSALAMQSAPTSDATRLGPWAVLGPFDCPGADVRVDTALEKHVKRMKAGEPWAALEESFPARGKAKLRWRWVREDELPRRAASAGVFDTGTLDLWALSGAGGAAGVNAVAYLYREIELEEARALELWCGSDDALRLWLDGEVVLERQALRALNPFDERVTLPFGPGKNHLLVKVTNAGGPWSLSMTEARPATSAEINAAIDRGVEWLLAHQLIDGSWRERQEDYPNGQTALTLYALLKSGLSPHHAATLQALAQLEAQPAARTYSLSCQILAVAALHDPSRKDWLAEMTGQLLAWQRGDGGWSYPGDLSDLSNTQFAALALRAAARAQVAIPASAWSELASVALRHQESRHKSEPSAGFLYVPGHDIGVTGSMTTAGVGVLAICREELGERMAPELRNQLNLGIDAGLAWLERHWTVTRNPNKADFHLYYLYGLERVGALLERERIGPHEWYPQGAEVLVRSQEASGAWKGSEMETCFALLFLSRATARPASQEKDLRLLASAPGPIRLRVRCGTPATFWIDPPAPGAGPDLARVEFFVRGPRGAWALAGQGEGQTLAAQHVFAGPGSWDVRAEAVLADGSRLVSETLAVPHEEGIDPARLAYASDALQNRVGAQGPEVRASSAAEPAANAADNRVWTRWLCQANDPDPWLEIELGKGLAASRLLLTHARTTLAENEKPVPRPARVELTIDREEPRLVDVDPDPRAKTAIELDSGKLQRIRLRIVALVDGELGRSSVGFSEIELQGSEAGRGR